MPKKLLDFIIKHSHLIISLLIGFILVSVWHKAIFELVNYFILVTMKELMTNIFNNERLVEALAVGLVPVITKGISKLWQWINK